MRITCPNCDATYEIDAELIPSEGRDVQCSACGRVWIQTRDGRREAASDGTGDDPAATAPPASDAAETDEDGDDALIDVGPEAPRRRPDEDTLRILREEAAREAARRRAPGQEPAAEPEPPATSEAQPAEAPRRGGTALSRPDRDEAPPSQAAAPERIPTPSRPDRDKAPAAGPRASRPSERRSDSGGDLLPDLDEINSTLTGPDRGRAEAPDPAPAERGRFTSGFLAILLIACVVVAVYYAAPWIAGRVPAAEAPLAAFVEAVNTARTWAVDRLDSFAQGIAALGG